MKPYIPKQEKRVRERIEIKLDAQVVRELERYCEYLDNSDRDYVVAQALEIAFRKDRGFTHWLSMQPAEPAPIEEAPEPSEARSLRRSRGRNASALQQTDSAESATLPFRPLRTQEERS